MFLDLPLSYVDVKEVDQSSFGYGNWKPVHAKEVIELLEPFSVEWTRNFVGIRVPLSRQNYQFMPLCWNAAVYVIAKGAPPIWYQLSLTVNNDFVQAIQFQSEPSSELAKTTAGKFLSIERLTSNRPIVSWEKG